MAYHKKKIQQNFNRASTTYDLIAEVQKTCAHQLIQQILQHFPAFYPASILDIGTGTGYIPEALLPFFPCSQYLLNDLSENMLCQARIKLGDKKNMAFLHGDMEQITLAHHALITSNFALQWANHLMPMLHHLYTHADRLAFSCLLNGTFAEWSTLFTELDLPTPTYAYPTEATLTGYLHGLRPQHCHITTQSFTLRFASLTCFIKYLQQLGANSSQHTLSHAHLRALLSKHPGPFSTTYHVYFAIIGEK